jgi:prepilin-type N-terminal cleavage/methylation domain-containing protein
MKSVYGFTLVEMAIVLGIIALILGTSLTLLSAQQDQRRIEDTNSRLATAQEALIGFAIAYGRLPCPASAASNGMESFASGGSAANGNCSNFYNGLLPASTLGLTPVDSQGFAIDAWGNRIPYAVTAANSHAFTITDGMKNAGISTLAPDLQVCSTSTGITATSCAAGSSLASNGVPVVIYSTGRNGAYGGTSADEAANLNNDRVFVYHTPNPDGATGGYFDDQLIWLSQYILFNRMIQAGKLP